MAAIDQHAYASVSDLPVTVWQEQLHAGRQLRDRIGEWLTELGCPDRQVLIRTDPWLDTVTVVGVEGDPLDENWVPVKDRDAARPRRNTTAGRAVARRMAQLTRKTARAALAEQTGMPASTDGPRTGGSFTVFSAELMETAGRVWALWEHPPTPAPDPAHWERVPLSAYFAAAEAARTAKQTAIAPDDGEKL